MKGQFKIGDKVTMIKVVDAMIPLNAKGVIIRLAPNTSRVRFGEDVHAFVSSGWWIHNKHLKLTGNDDANRVK